MISVEFHNDDARVETLRSLQLLDTPPEAEFDEVVKLAAEICRTPISLVSLVDDHRQWFKAAVGLDVPQTPRDISFCAHAIQQPDLFLVPDTLSDERFSDNPLVVSDPLIRFYAGVPLRTPDGHAMGTLCVIDRVPRILRRTQQEALEILASQLMARFEMRLKQRELQAALAENQRVTAELKASEELFRLFMNHSPFLSYIKDPQGRFIYYNAEMAKRFQIDAGTWIGRHDHDIWPREIADRFRRHDQQVLAEGAAVELAEFTPGPNGEITPWKSFKFPYTDSAGNLLLAGVSVNMTEELRREKELQEANLLLQELAISDELTGLGNRRAMQEALLREFSAARRRHRDLSLLMIDIDSFKSRNDRWGHAAGDDALMAMGAILSSVARVTDVPVRCGGDEFMVLLPETDAAGAHQIAERIQHRVAATTWQHHPVTISIGVGSLTPQMLHSHQLVADADAALYLAKGSGKNSIRSVSAAEPVAAEPPTV